MHDEEGSKLPEICLVSVSSNRVALMGVPLVLNLRMDLLMHLILSVFIDILVEILEDLVVSAKDVSDYKLDGVFALIVGDPFVEVE